MSKTGKRKQQSNDRDTHLPGDVGEVGAQASLNRLLPDDDGPVRSPETLVSQHRVANNEIRYQAELARETQVMEIHDHHFHATCLGDSGKRTVFGHLHFVV